MGSTSCVDRGRGSGEREVRRATLILESIRPALRQIDQEVSRSGERAIGQNVEGQILREQVLLLAGKPINPTGVRLDPGREARDLSGSHEQIVQPVAGEVRGRPRGWADEKVEQWKV